MAEEVTLRPLAGADLVILERLTQDPAATSEFAWLGWHNPAQYRQSWEDNRIEAATEVGNVAEQRALEKAGFTREGVLRSTGWWDGAYRDGVWYSMLRTDQPG